MISVPSTLLATGDILLYSDFWVCLTVSQLNQAFLIGFRFLLTLFVTGGIPTDFSV